MRNNYEDLIPDGPLEGDVYQKIDRCEKILRIIRRSVLMRLVLTGLLVYIPFGAKLQGSVTLLILLVAAINLTGLLPLISQWRLKKKELDQLLDEE